MLFLEFCTNCSKTDLLFHFKNPKTSDTQNALTKALPPVYFPCIIAESTILLLLSSSLQNHSKSMSESFTFLGLAYFVQANLFSTLPSHYRERLLIKENWAQNTFGRFENQIMKINKVTGLRAHPSERSTPLAEC